MGWTQEDLAREIGVSISTVQRWEGKGCRPIRIIARELERLYKKAGIDTHQAGKSTTTDKVKSERKVKG